MLSKKLGKYLRDMRQQKGLNLEELSQDIGFSVSKLSKIENGIQMPTVSDFEVFSEYFGVPITSLLAAEKVRTDTVSSGNLVEKFLEVAKLYAAEDRENFAGSSIGKIITKDIPLILNKEANINPTRFLVVGSIGKGQYAEIPWISVFNKSITESATKGIYIVYLYTADMKGIYLSLNQGYTYFKDSFGSKKAKQEIERMADTLRNIVYIPDSMRMDTIDLKATKPLGKGYMAGHIAGKYYDLKNMPSECDMISDLLELIDVYNAINLQIGNRTPEQFYDYMVAIEQGLINDDREINYEMQDNSNISLEESEDELKDEPKEKREPVIDKDGKKRYPRDPKEIANALKRANYTCEVDDRHKTFTGKATGKHFVEGHHLIPLNKSDLFGYSLDIPANICSLCPLCHRAIHLATDDVKKEILLKLFDNERRERLEKAGIIVSFDQLIKFYGIE